MPPRKEAWNSNSANCNFFALSLLAMCRCQRTARVTGRGYPAGDPEKFSFNGSPSFISAALLRVTLQGGFEVVGVTGLEPVTLRLSSACSNQLSYTPLK